MSADKTLGYAVMIVLPDGTPVGPITPLPVAIEGGVSLSGPVTVSNEVEVKNDAGSPIPVAVGLAAATRSYNFAAATRTAVGVASVSAALGTLSADREVMLTASTDCYVAFGTSSGVSVAATDAAALRLFAGERFHLRLAAGITHYAVIRDSADGYLRVTPVA